MRELPIPGKFLCLGKSAVMEAVVQNDDVLVLVSYMLCFLAER